MMFDENVHNLCNVHPWMTFDEAWLLLKWSYVKNKTQEGYFGKNTLLTLMDIDFRIYQRKDEEWLKERIVEAKKKFNYID